MTGNFLHAVVVSATLVGLPALGLEEASADPSDCWDGVPCTEDSQPGVLPYEDGFPWEPPSASEEPSTEEDYLWECTDDSHCPPGMFCFEHRCTHFG